MSEEFKKRLDSWLGLQDSFGIRLKEFRELITSYFGNLDVPPTELKSKLNSLEQSVDALKTDFIEVISDYLELGDVAQALITGGKKADIAAEVAQAGANRPQVKPSTVDVPIHTAAVEEAVPESLDGLPNKGLLGYMNYDEWYHKQSPDDQTKIEAIFNSDARFKERDLLHTPITFLPPKMASYLYQTANKLLAAEYDDMGVALLIKGLTIVTDKTDKEMIHIIYAKYFYRQRKELKDAYVGCISHCEKAIKSFVTDKEPRNKPIAPFKLLTKIYEEKEQYDKIKGIAEKAVSLYESSATPERGEGFKKILDALAQRGVV